MRHNNESADILCVKLQQMAKGNYCKATKHIQRLRK